ncbi:FAD-dependent oxidoreductase [Mycolicibacterium agri]|uniref:Membrane protein n=1 Tax=Mycolicibacterium agri TaxID=36811 RepID=A0A7I9W7A1_MYCAG|nr:FAD-dependent oxidoreductase [Mycolicibacterium agri]GFG53289.1 membrane protein [Mycolicibacterium agri]
MPGETEFDVIVVGGGTAGVAAAISAARAGARTALVERSGFLGGTMTGVSLGSLCGFYMVDEQGRPQMLAGSIPAEIVERLRSAGGAPAEPVDLLQTSTVPYDPFVLKRVLDDVVAEARVSVFAQSWGAEPLCDGDRVTGVRIYSGQGRGELRCAALVDASGDAVIAAAAGVECVQRPDLQSPTAMFRFGGVDTDTAIRLSRDDLRAALECAIADGVSLPRTAGGMFSVRPGVVHVNITRLPVPENGAVLAPEELGWLEREGRKQVSLYEAVFRRYVPGFADAFVIDAGTHLGIRESRRLVGRYTLTGDDVRSGARFDDGIACCAWPMETHGVDQSVTWEWLRPGVFYQIPLRSLLPRTIDGIMVAGRSLSADPVAHASARVSAPCMAMGEAAGLTAAISARTAKPPASVPSEYVCHELRQRGAFLG